MQFKGLTETELRQAKAALENLKDNSGRDVARYLDEKRKESNTVQECLDLCGTNISLVSSKCRHQDVIDKRWLFWWLLRNQYKWTYSDIAAISGHHHASVIHGVKKQDKRFKEWQDHQRQGKSEGS